MPAAFPKAFMRKRPHLQGYRPANTVTSVVSTILPGYAIT